MSLKKFIRKEDGTETSDDKLISQIKRRLRKENEQKEIYILKKDEEKEFNLAFKAFKKFIKNGFNRKYFTKRIYGYLMYKCDFIAHFDIDNFYNTYFTTIKGFNKFIEKMSKFDNIIVEELDKFTKNKL